MHHSRSVYVLLGIHSSGREQALADLIHNGLLADNPVPVYTSPTETDTALLGTLSAENNIDAGEWQIDPNGTLFIDPLEEDQRAIFLIGDGVQTPVDLMEALSTWMRNHPDTHLVISTVVHSAQCEQHPQIKEWYNACIHFSDVVLLNQREGISPKWVNHFIDHFAKQHYPCVFDLIKQGRIPNPALVLDSPARRLSHAFEPLDDFEDIEIEGDDSEDDEESLRPDPYFERLMNGRRAISVPDIRSLLIDQGA